MQRDTMEAVEQRAICRRAYVEAIIDPLGRLTPVQFRAMSRKFRLRLAMLEDDFVVEIPNAPGQVVQGVYCARYPALEELSNFERNEAAPDLAISS